MAWPGADDKLSRVTGITADGDTYADFTYHGADMIIAAGQETRRAIR